MITRFRIEGEGASPEDVRELLSDLAVDIFNRLRTGYEQGDGTANAWELTDEVISLRRSEKGYQGRMVFVYRG